MSAHDNCGCCKHWRVDGTPEERAAYDRADVYRSNDGKPLAQLPARLAAPLAAAK